MKAIPMRGRLAGKRLNGYLWAGPGKSWRRKENYFQLEHDKLLTAVLEGPNGAFWIRCKGATCEIKLYGQKGEIVSTTIIALPRGRKR